MKSCLRLLAASSFSVMFFASHAFAQQAAFTEDAESAFSFFVGQASIGSLFPRSSAFGADDATSKRIIEEFIRKYQLTTENRWEPPLGWGGLWKGRNPSGAIALYIASPEPLSRRNDIARVTFWPPSEQQIPPSVLNHLLAMATRTRLLGATEMAIELPFEDALGSCSSQSTLTIRITTGGLVANEVTTRCKVPGAN